MACRIKIKIKFLVTKRRFAKLTQQYQTIRLAADEEWRKISDEIKIVFDAK